MNKEYIIPTKKWLVPIKKMISNDISTAGLLIIAKLIEKEKVIVKITKMNSKYIPYITEKLSYEPNFIKTIMAFTCYEKEYLLNNNYNNINSFCNGDDNDKIITIEVMKRYIGSFNKLQKKLNIIEFKKILGQLINAQINVFYKFGFVHNDIHLGNILYDISIKKIKLMYTICKSQYSNSEDNRLIFNEHLIEVNDIIPYICDFEKSQCYNPDIFRQYDKHFLENMNNYMEETNTLFSNLTKTVNMCILLLEDKEETFILKQNLNNLIQSEHFEQWALWNMKTYGKYFSKLIDWIEFRDKTISLCSKFVNSVMYYVTEPKTYSKNIIPERCFISQNLFKKK